MCSFEIAKALCVLQRFPNEVDGKEWVFQWNSASWLFAAICFCECASRKVESEVCKDGIGDEESEEKGQEFELSEHIEV